MIRKFFNPDEKDSAGISPLDQEIIKERFGSEAVKQIMDFRMRAENLYVTARTLKPSRYVSLTITAFQIARQFTGIMLKEKGQESPYKSSMNPESSHIEKQADKGEVLKEVDELPDEVSKVKKMRAIAADLTTDINVYLADATPASPIDYIAQTEVLKNIISGKLWLGERLGEIRDEQEKAGN